MFFYAIMISVLAPKSSYAMTRGYARRSIHSSHLELDSKDDERLLQANNCVGDLYQGNLICAAEDLKIGVTGSTVHDAGAYEDGNVWKGVCAEVDDYVSISLAVTMEFNPSRYDVGM